MRVTRSLRRDGRARYFDGAATLVASRHCDETIARATARQAIISALWTIRTDEFWGEEYISQEEARRFRDDWREESDRNELLDANFHRERSRHIREIQLFNEMVKGLESEIAELKKKRPSCPLKRKTHLFATIFSFVLFQALFLYSFMK